MKKEQPFTEIRIVRPQPALLEKLKSIAEKEDRSIPYIAEKLLLKTLKIK